MEIETELDQLNNKLVQIIIEKEGSDIRFSAHEFINHRNTGTVSTLMDLGEVEALIKRLQRVRRDLRGA